MNERRLQRLQEQIKQRLAEVLQRDLADPKLGLVTITRVEVDSEFTQCRAYWSVLAGDPAKEQRARRDSDSVLQKARGLCQRELGKVLHTRTVPHLEFVFDEGIRSAIRMNHLLDELKQERHARGDTEDLPPSEPVPDEPRPLG
ncbi:MAG: 30S ribosome-binding factor RbfA [Planctomycetes bacterium]|nr:30S ribosome-binding factor RbfA [Planctomycetota bacterium]